MGRIPLNEPLRASDVWMVIRYLMDPNISDISTISTFGKHYKKSPKEYAMSIFGKPEDPIVKSFCENLPDTPIEVSETATKFFRVTDDMDGALRTMSGTLSFISETHGTFMGYRANGEHAKYYQRAINDLVRLEQELGTLLPIRTQEVNELQEAEFARMRMLNFAIFSQGGFKAVLYLLGLIFKPLIDGVEAAYGEMTEYENTHPDGPKLEYCSTWEKLPQIKEVMLCQPTSPLDEAREKNISLWDPSFSSVPNTTFEILKAVMAFLHLYMQTVPIRAHMKHLVAGDTLCSTCDSVIPKVTDSDSKQVETADESNADAEKATNVSIEDGESKVSKSDGEPESQPNEASVKDDNGDQSGDEEDGNDGDDNNDDNPQAAFCDGLMDQWRHSYPDHFEKYVKGAGSHRHHGSDDSDDEDDEDGEKAGTSGEVEKKATDESAPKEDENSLKGAKDETTVAEVENQPATSSTEAEVEPAKEESAS